MKNCWNPLILKNSIPKWKGYGKAETLRQSVSEKISEILDQESGLQDRNLRNQVLKEVLQEALGLGPLEDLLVDSSISEIMVNAWNEIYVEKKAG
ncbi:MAG: hypothetical protein R2860_02450 [Desulfobacterales bacterium]